MKKQDVLDAIQSKFTSVLSIREVENIGNVRWYLANVFDAEGKQAAKRNVGFYVVDEGEPSEAAYWHGGEPKLSVPPVPTFQQYLQEYLSALIDAGTIEGGIIQAVDAINETATVAIWVVSGTDIVSKEFFVDKDAGSWRHREIVSI